MSTYVVGLDLGSTSADCVVIDEDNAIVGSAVVQTGTVSKAGMQRALAQVFDELGITADQVRATGATGYGRRLIPGGVDHIFTEISAHARGVAALFPGVRLVVDIGGQDTKAIRVDANGYVERFAMNDRCASGTGRFYEGLAHALETDLESLGDLAARGQTHLEISSLCATFAITEVIALLAKGEDAADIAASVHLAAAARAVGLVGQVGKVTPIAVTGGVALNAAAVRSLAAALDEELLVPDDPQITGALGAALLTAERLAQGPAAVADTPADKAALTAVNARAVHDHDESAHCADCASGQGTGTTTILTLTTPSGRT